MANPTNSTNTTVTEETYNTLKKIKEQTGWTFSEILDKLCELEMQHNYVENIVKYDLVYQDKVFRFEITFKKNNFTIEYFNSNGENTTINKWGLDKKIVSEFYEFINEDCARCMFQNMPIGLIFKEFDIYKI